MVRKNYNLHLYSLHGTISHYYHFFFGVLIPLIKFYSELQDQDSTLIIKDDLGTSMLRLLFSLPIDIKYKPKIKYDNMIDIHIQPMDIHPNKVIDGENDNNIKDLIMVQKGYAQHFTYDVKKQVCKWLSSQFKLYDLDLLTEYYDIVIIERKIDKKFHTIVYNDSKYDNMFKKSGAERRTISNHNDIVNLIKQKYRVKTLSISLEHLPFFNQYKLFRNAKIVVAQHGASLANICFMHKNTLVIELISDLILKKRENWFMKISKKSKVKHIQYITKSIVKSLLELDIATIDINHFNNFLETNNDIIMSTINY